MRGFEGEFAQAVEADCSELSADEPGNYLPKNAAAKPEILRELEFLNDESLLENPVAESRA